MKSSYLQATDFNTLNQACRIILETFQHAPHLVGSCHHSEDYRDVDIRLILPDEEYEKFFGTQHYQIHNPMWVLLTTSISLYLKHNTGLPIDFQFQKMSWANEHFPSKKHPRIPLGIVINDAHLR